MLTCATPCVCNIQSSCGFEPTWNARHCESICPLKLCLCEGLCECEWCSGSREACASHGRGVEGLGHRCARMQVISSQQRAAAWLFAARVFSSSAGTNVMGRAYLLNILAIQPAAHARGYWCQRERMGAAIVRRYALMGHAQQPGLSSWRQQSTWEGGGQRRASFAGRSYRRRLRACRSEAAALRAVTSPRKRRHALVLVRTLPAFRRAGPRSAR